MAFEVHDGQGSLFQNERKEKPSQPDYTGDLRIGGVLYRLAGWKKKAASGIGYLSLSIKPDQQQEPQAKAQETEFDDSIPF
jgi:hypothetical protein